jgi:hypothetical protein
MTMMVIDEDHYVFTVAYGAGSYTLTRKKIGTRYALVAIRILVDPTDPKDVEQVNTLQDAIKVQHPGGPGKFVASAAATSSPIARSGAAGLLLLSRQEGRYRRYSKREDGDLDRGLEIEEKRSRRQRRASERPSPRTSGKESGHPKQRDCIPPVGAEPE